MHAIVKVGPAQYKIAEGDVIDTNRLTELLMLMRGLTYGLRGYPDASSPDSLGLG